jgi:hypothetical protein
MTGEQRGNNRLSRAFSQEKRPFIGEVQGAFGEQPCGQQFVGGGVFRGKLTSVH